MTNQHESIGARLARLRRAENITQEALAERLGVSRQAVSKWESDLTYPETDKLLRLSRLYGVTVDYLLTGEATGSAPKTTQNTANATDAQPCETVTPPEDNANGFDDLGVFWAKRPRYFEYKSRRTVGGIPLVHINIGRGRTATGIVAVGLAARGVVAIGPVAVGVVALGLASVGVLSLGVAALGFLLAVGCIAVGAMAIGVIAVGLVAIGALSVGLVAVGAMAVGHYLGIGDCAYGLVTVGKTLSDGEAFAHLGPLTLHGESLAAAEVALETCVPAWLRSIALWILACGLRLTHATMRPFGCQSARIRAGIFGHIVH